MLYNLQGSNGIHIDGCQSVTVRRRGLNKDDGGCYLERKGVFRRGVGEVEWSGNAM